MKINALHQQLQINLHPSAAELERLTKLNPAYADCIIEQFKKQGDHRMEMEGREIKRKEEQDTFTFAHEKDRLQSSNRGQWMTFSLAMGLLFLSGYSLYLHESTMAGILGAGGFAPIIWSLIAPFIGRQKNN